MQKNEIKKILETHKKFTSERNFDPFQTPKNLAMALSVETAELVEIFTWLTEKQSLALSAERRVAAGEEIADIFIYLVRMADLLGVDLIEEASQKMEKNFAKHSIEKGQAFAKELLNCSQMTGQHKEENTRD
jgi:NTP pyrophosphatase (non-canonical NTP hydrolase)